MEVNINFLMELKPALDQLPEAVTFVRVWTGESASGGEGQMLSFVWQDDAWHVRPDV